MSAYLKKIERPSVVQYVIDSLTQALLDGALKPGDRIPTEMELAQQLGVARNSVREAVKILVYIGVLEIRRAEGTFVCSGFTGSLVDPMIYGIILSQRNTRELNELRATMESGVLHLAMHNRTDEQMDLLRQRLADLRDAIFEPEADTEKVFECDNAFHAVITGMCHNDMVARINEMVFLLTRSVRLDSDRYMIAAGRGRELYEAHERIYALLEERQTASLYDVVRSTYFTVGGDAV